MDRPEISPVAEATPARRWRNWYRSIVDHESAGGFRKAGEEWHGTEAFDSEREAEGMAQAAIEIRQMAREVEGRGEEGDPTIYLGARADG